MPVFLKYGQIKGDAREPAHRSWIELTGVLGAHNASVSSGASPNLTEVFVTKKADSASARLQQEAIGGKNVPAIIEFVRDEGGVSLRLEMSETMISSYIRSGRGDPGESLTLNFTKIEFKYIPGTPAP